MTGENKTRILSREEALDDLRLRCDGDDEFITNHHWSRRHEKEEVLRNGAMELLAGLGSCELPFSYFVHGSTAHIVTGYTAEEAVTRANELIEELGPAPEISTSARSPVRVRSILAGFAADGREITLDGEVIQAQEGSSNFR